MDTTKESIKMCEKAVEIQELWKPDNLDIFVSKKDGSFIPFQRDFLWDAECIENMKKHLIWLPRQYQLQEMVKSDLTLLGTLRDFLLFCQNVRYPFTSMEQLWLAFVMKEKFNKVWDGGNWL